MASRTIQSVARALDVLELYSVSVPELSIKEISTGMNLSKSTVHGLVSTLVERGYLHQNMKNQKYRLGLKIMGLGRIVKFSLDFRTVAFPLIENLSKRVNETIHLVIWNGEEAVYIEKIDGSAALSMISQVGRRALLHCTGVGKAILAYLDGTVQNKVLERAVFHQFTSKTIVNADALRDQLQTIRELGYAEDNEEIEVGLKCVAAPIFNYTFQVVGSISCSGPNQRMREKETEVISLVKETAKLISKKLGYLENLETSTSYSTEIKSF